MMMMTNDKKMSPKEFVSSFYPYALKTQNKTGIDARFILAQAALETAWGESAPGNMFFGIKAGRNTPDGKKQLLRTREILLVDGATFPEVISTNKLASGKYEYIVKDWFRKYDSPEESFTDHAKFFFENKRYKDALRVKDDPYKFAEAIARAGYATDPNYANSLKAVIRTVEKNIPKDEK